MKDPDKRRPETLLAHLGRDPKAHFGAVNTPVYHASTLLHESVEAFEEAGRNRWVKGRSSYGRSGTPSTFAFEETVAQLEGAYGAVAVSSGLQAIAVALLSFTKAGDHILVPDTIYFPGRRICEELLREKGIETTFYDPTIGGGIAALVRDKTRLIYLESPGSLTFEVQDIPAIAAVARDAGVITVIDNTWATPLFLRPLDFGIDVSLHAATKYLVGHSDAMLGVIATREGHYERIRRTGQQLGCAAAPDDLYLGLRGLRTLAVRLDRHQQNALRLAEWLRARPEVDRLLYPALPEDPGHEIWKRDFKGATGLFGFVLKPCARDSVAAMIDGMEFFGIGASWGGFESLMILTDPRPIRTATQWSDPGPVVRIHVGLEHSADLIADLEAGFDRLNAAEGTLSARAG